MLRKVLKLIFALLAFGAATAQAADFDNGAPVKSIVWRPQGDYLAVVGTDGTTNNMLFYDQPSQSFKNCTGASFNRDGNVSVVAWSKDGNFFAVGGKVSAAGNMIDTYSFAPNGTTPTLTLIASANQAHSDDPGTGSSISALDWSNTGNLLAVGDDTNQFDNSQAYKFDKNAKTLTRVAFSGLAGYMGITSIKWRPGTKDDYLLVCNKYGQSPVRILYLDGTKLTKLPGGDMGFGRSGGAFNVLNAPDAEWSPDGNFIIWAGGSRTLNGPSIAGWTYYFDIVNGITNRLLQGYLTGTAGSNNVSWNSDGTAVAIGCNKDSNGVSRRVFKFNPTTQTMQEMASGQANMGSFVAWNPAQPLLASVNTNATGAAQMVGVASIDLTGALSAPMPTPIPAGDIVDPNPTGFEGGFLTSDWTLDGKYLTIGTNPTTIDGQWCTHRVFSYDPVKQALTELNGCRGYHGSQVYAIAWSRDKKYIAVGGWTPSTPSRHDLRVYKFDEAAQTLTEIPACRILAGDSTTGPNSGPNVNYLAWNNDGTVLAVAVSNNNPSYDAIMYQFTNETLSPIASSAFATDGQCQGIWWHPIDPTVFVSMGKYGAINRVQRFDSTTGKVRIVGQPFNFGMGAGAGAGATSMAWHAGGQYLLVSGDKTSLLDNQATSARVYSVDLANNIVQELVQCRVLTDNLQSGNFKVAGWNSTGTAAIAMGQSSFISGDIPPHLKSPTDSTDSLVYVTHHIYLFGNVNNQLRLVEATELMGNIKYKDASGNMVKGGPEYYDRPAWSPVNSVFTLSPGNGRGLVYYFDTSKLTFAGRDIKPLPNLTMPPSTNVSFGSGLFTTVWNPTQNYVAVGGYNNNNIFATYASTRLYQYDPTKGLLTEAPWGLTADGQGTHSLSWTPDGQYLAAGAWKDINKADSNNLFVYKYDFTKTTITTLASLNVGPGAVQAVAWDPTGKYLAVGSTQITLYSFDGTTLTPMFDSIKNTGFITSDIYNWVVNLAWSPNGVFLLASGYNGSLGIYQFDPQKTGFGSRLAGGSFGQATAIAWNPDGLNIAIGGSNVAAEGNSSVKLLQFIQTGSTFTLTDVPTSRVNAGANATAVRWVSNGSALIVGVDQGFKTYNFNRAAGTLEPLAQTGTASNNVLSLDTSTDESCLILNAGGVGPTGQVYQASISSFIRPPVKTFTTMGVGIQPRELITLPKIQVILSAAEIAAANTTFAAEKAASDKIGLVLPMDTDSIRIKLGDRYFVAAQSTNEHIPGYVVTLAPAGTPGTVFVVRRDQGLLLATIINGTYAYMEMVDLIVALAKNNITTQESISFSSAWFNTGLPSVYRFNEELEPKSTGFYLKAQLSYNGTNGTIQNTPATYMQIDSSGNIRFLKQAADGSYSLPIPATEATIITFEKV